MPAQYGIRMIKKCVREVTQTQEKVHDKTKKDAS